MMTQEIKVYIKLVVFGMIENDLSVFLTDNRLPSTPLTTTLNLELPVKQLFQESIKSPVEKHYFEQLYTISSVNEKITIVYFVLVENAAGDTSWQKIKNIDAKNKDFEIISYALQRLRWKVEYTNVVYSLLPKEFTLSLLQKTYESVLGHEIDKRNFRKKILSLKFLEPTTKKKTGPARPAQLYRFKKRDPEIIKVFS